jgi:hypothetical protein
MILAKINLFHTLASHKKRCDYTQRIRDLPDADADTPDAVTNESAHPKRRPTSTNNQPLTELDPVEQSGVVFLRKQDQLQTQTP